MRKTFLDAWSSLVFVACLSQGCAEAGPAELEVMPERDIGSRDEAFRTASGGTADHGDMTESALSFIKEGVAEQLADENENTDSGSTQLQSRYHLDNCRVEEGFALLRQLFDQAVEALDPNAPQLGMAIRHFGTALHTVQDFYSHSNWYESGQGVLVSRDDFFWPWIRPGERLGQMIVLGPGLPSSWTLRRDSGSRIPMVFADDAWQPGFMTGTYADNTDPSICPASVDIPHGPFLLPQWMEYDDFLAKDAPLSPHHDETLRMAKQQTRQEVCRLDRLLLLRHGERGRELLLREWVRDQGAFDAECPNDRGLVTSLTMRVFS